ncbi:YcxB family protein [Aliikangiella sp. IMCC44632]
MSQIFSESVSFILDKKHFQECFEQSAPPVEPKDYRKAIAFAVISVALMFIEAEHYYIPYFIFCLAIVEVFSIQFRQTWWVWRQLMSKAAFGKVELTINEEGVETASEYVNSQIKWADVSQIIKTEKGFLLEHKKGKNYLSKAHLSPAMFEFIVSKAQQKPD